MSRCLVILILSLTVIPARAEANKSTVLLDEVVAIVDLRETRVLLLSDLQMEARLARAKVSGGQTLKAPVDEVMLSATLDRLINQLVVVDEAARLQLFEPTKAEIDAGVDSLRNGIGAEAFDAFVTEFELEETIREIVRRETRFARYLESRFRLASKPREPDVQAWVAAHLDGRDVAVLTAEARERLAKTRFDQLSSAFVADVRRRARIRILRDPSAALAPTPLSGTVSMSETTATAGK